MISKLRHWLRSVDYGILIALIIPMIGILPTFGEGLANGADAPFHAHRIYALSELIQQGDFYPRWVSYFHMGYGYPVFNFYAPGATHIGAWFHLIGFDVVTAYQLLNALMWSLGSLGVYLLARTCLPIRAALLACVIWAYAPSRFYEFWWQGSIAQTVATSFIPFVFYGIIRTSRMPSLKNSLWIAFPFAGIVLSHTPTTYFTALFVGAFCIVAPLGQKSFSQIVKRWIYIGSGLAISAGLSAIFLIPVFAEVGFVRIAGDLPDTIDFLRRGFVTIDELFDVPSIIDRTDVTLLMPRTLGLVGGILSVIGFFVLLVKKRFAIAIMLLIGVLFTLFMAMESSLDIWLLIPSFRNLRFPERILRMGALCIALLGASALLLIPRRWQLVGFIGISFIVILQALPITHPRDDNRIWQNLSAVDEIMMEFDEKNWGTTAYDEYEPYWGEVTPLDMPPDVESYRDNPLQIRLLESDVIRRAEDLIDYQQRTDNRIEIELTRSRRLRFRQFYFPGWRLTVDGDDFPFQPDERFGLIEARFPEGKHIIELNYVGTPIQHLSTLISIVTLLSCVFIIFRGDKTQSVALVDDLIRPQHALFIISSFIIFALINRDGLQDQFFRIQSPSQQPHYMQTSTNATFDENVTLLGYTLDANTISQDNPLGIRLYWKVEEPSEHDYRPIVQLVNWTIDESWAVSQPLDFEGGKISKLPTDKFMSDGHRLNLLGDTPPYIAQISVQLRESSKDGNLVTLADGSNRLILPNKIWIDEPTQPYRGESWNINVDEKIVIHCLGRIRTEEEYQIDMWLEVREALPLDYKIFVHGLDLEGNIVRQADRFPMDGSYPTSFWRPQQTLHDTLTLGDEEAIERIAIGFYHPIDGTRLPITIDGTTNDHIAISTEEESCAP